jgi:hypothetical protein
VKWKFGKLTALGPLTSEVVQWRPHIVSEFGWDSNGVQYRRETDIWKRPTLHWSWVHFQSKITKPNSCFSHYNACTSIFLSHTDIRIFLMHSYPDQSTLVYTPNILHAYWGKACIFCPILVIGFLDSLGLRIPRIPRIFMATVIPWGHALPRGARCLSIGHGSINRRASKAFAHHLFILHALC